ncbi:MAG: hypothetical protein ACREU7_02000 [Burkholderiales bacterium]
MTRFLVALAIILAAAGQALAIESGYTLRPTELKSQPFVDASTVATLPEKTQVEIVTRQGAWMQVRTKDSRSQGWVRMLSVRLGDPNQKPGSGSILSAIGIGNRPRPQTTATVTTGVRGFSEEDLKEAKPNPGEVDKMESFAANSAHIGPFVQSGQLSSREVTYFDDKGRPVEAKK